MWKAVKDKLLFMFNLLFFSDKSRLVRTGAHPGCEGIHTKGNLKMVYCYCMLNNKPFTHISRLKYNYKSKMYFINQ